tara:strand:+ start:100 stop:357 length:258 start_codon:yes stop_codon:yes gene_type:complete
MNLANLRQEIDKLDDQLMNLIAKRMLLASAIAQVKRDNNLPIFQPEREKELLGHKMKLAQELNLDQFMVKEIFEILLKASKEIQK